jgi:hypothetical protein
VSDDPRGTVRWFGSTWFAPVNDLTTHVPTPVGETCSHCREPITEEDQGVTVPHLGPERAVTVWHLDCFLETVGVLQSVRRALRHKGDGE